MFRERQDLYSEEEIIASRIALRQSIVAYSTNHQLDLQGVKETKKVLEISLDLRGRKGGSGTESLNALLSDIYEGRFISIDQMRITYAPARSVPNSFIYDASGEEKEIPAKEGGEYGTTVEIDVYCDQTIHEKQQKKKFEGKAVLLVTREQVLEDRVSIHPDYNLHNLSLSFDVQKQSYRDWLNSAVPVHELIYGFVEPPIIHEIAGLVPVTTNFHQIVRSHRIY
jgi:hypothetical protein